MPQFLTPAFLLSYSRNDIFNSRFEIGVFARASGMRRGPRAGGFGKPALPIDQYSHIVGLVLAGPLPVLIDSWGI